MCFFDRHDLKPSRSPWRPGARKLLHILALSTVALAAAAFSVSAIVVSTDPDWVGIAPTNISNSGTRKTLHPAVAAGPSGQVVVAWNDLPPGEPKADIYVTHSGDSGKSWPAKPQRVLETAAKSQLPDIAIAEGKTFVAWTEEKSQGDGTTTLTVHEAELGGDFRTIQTEAGDSSGIPTAPRLSASSNRLHVVFNAGQMFSHIFYSSRALSETTWPPAQQIYTSTASMSWFPALAVTQVGGDPIIHVAWEKLSGEGRSIWYMSGTTAGSDVSWSSPLPLSSQSTSVKPDVAVSSDGNVHLVWGEAESEQTSAAYYVRYCRYDRSRKSCSESKRVDAQPVYVNEISPTESSPRLALWEDGGQIHLCVTWHGFRKGESAEDTLVSCSEDGGKTWQPARTMSPLPEGVSGSADISIWPSIVFDPFGTLHGVWQQRVDIVGAESYYEIYYSHSMNRVFLPLIIRNG